MCKGLSCPSWQHSRGAGGHGSHPGSPTCALPPQGLAGVRAGLGETCEPYPGRWCNVHVTPPFRMSSSRKTGTLRFTTLCARARQLRVPMVSVRTEPADRTHRGAWLGGWDGALMPAAAHPLPARRPSGEPLLRSCHSLAHHIPGAYSTPFPSHAPEACVASPPTLF